MLDYKMILMYGSRCYNKCVNLLNVAAFRSYGGVRFSSDSLHNSKTLSVRNVDSAIYDAMKIQNCEHYKIFSSYGFSAGQINRILHPINNVVSISSRDIADNLAMWHAFRVENKNLLSVLSSVPELLTLNPLYVKHREEELMSLFTQKNISKLLITCPGVFLDDFETILQKVEYMINFMEVEQPSIVKTEALKFDIEHIKLRHIFVRYVGAFKSYKKEKNRNPPLSKVLSSNINTLIKLSHVTEEEYIAFCNCYDDIKDDLFYKFETETDSEIETDSEAESDSDIEDDDLKHSSK